MARAIIILPFFLASICRTNGQSFGTVPTTLARIESKLEDVSETSTRVANATDQMESLLNDHTQQLNTMTDQQEFQNQLLETMVGLLPKQDKHLENLTEQQSIQNQILSAQTNLLHRQTQVLQYLSKQQTVQNQMMNNVVDLLQKHDHQTYETNHQLNSIAEQSIVQNQILSMMSNMLGKQDLQLGNLTEGIQHQTNTFDAMVSSLQNMTESVQNMTQIQESQPTSSDSAKESSPTAVAENCQHILSQCFTENYGIHQIQPSCSSQSFDVVCDLDTSPGGWIVFQRRFDGWEEFYRGWQEYKNGFGNLDGEFWLGLEKMYNITRRGIWQLRVDLEDHSGNFAFAEYSNFAIGDESDNYRLSLGEYSGTAGDALSYHSGIGFTTYDQDHDTGSGNCAVSHHGAWWYRSCSNNIVPDSNLNGRHYDFPSRSLSGMVWYYSDYSYDVVKKSEMKMRRL